MKDFKTELAHLLLRHDAELVADTACNYPDKIEIGVVFLEQDKYMLLSENSVLAAEDLSHD